MARWFFVISLVAFEWTAGARVFKNSYVQFDLPDTWSCNQEGAAWVCAPTNKGDAREALIVSTAKLAGPDDNLNGFYNHLRVAKTLVGKGSSSLSRPLSIDRRKIANQDWIEAVHIGSEVPNFKTHYLVTVKQNLALSVSFSTDRDVEQKYSAIFERAIKSIKVDTSKPILIKPVAMPIEDPKSVIGQIAKPPTPFVIPPDSSAARQRKLWLYGLIALAGVGVLFLIRKLV